MGSQGSQHSRVGGSGKGASVIATFWVDAALQAGMWTGGWSEWAVTVQAALRVRKAGQAAWQVTRGVIVLRGSQAGNKCQLACTSASRQRPGGHQQRHMPNHPPTHPPTCMHRCCRRLSPEKMLSGASTTRPPSPNEGTQGTSGANQGTGM